MWRMESSQVRWSKTYGISRCRVCWKAKRNCEHSSKEMLTRPLTRQRRTRNRRRVVCTGKRPVGVANISLPNAPHLEADQCWIVEVQERSSRAGYRHYCTVKVAWMIPPKTYYLADFLSIYWFIGFCSTNPFVVVVQHVQDIMVVYIHILQTSRNTQLSCTVCCRCATD